MATFTTKQAFSEGWIATKRYGLFFYGILLLGVLGMLISDLLTKFSSSLGIVSLLLYLLSLFFLYIALPKFTAQAVRGEVITSKSLFSTLTFGHVGNFILLGILSVLGYFIGLFLLIIPGIIFLLSVSQAAYLVIDKDMSAIKAIKESFALMKGNRVDFFFFGAISGVILILSFITLIPWIVVLPLVSFAQASVYTQLLKASPALSVTPSTPGLTSPIKLSDEAIGTAGSVATQPAVPETASVAPTPTSSENSEPQTPAA